MNGDDILKFGKFAERVKSVLGPSLHEFQVIDDKLLATAGKDAPQAFGWLIKYRDPNGLVMVITICGDA